VFDKLAKTLFNAHRELKEKADRFNTAHMKLLVHYVPLLKRAAKKRADAEAALLKEVKAHPEAFDKPRSQKLLGWKYGFQKKTGKVEVPDEEKTIKLIKKHLPKLVSQLIIKKEAVSKDAVAKLTVEQAKKISVNVVEDGDVAFAKLIDTQAAKIVKQALKNAEVSAR